MYVLCICVVECFCLLCMGGWYIDMYMLGECFVYNLWVVGMIFI